MIRRTCLALFAAVLARGAAPADTKKTAKPAARQVLAPPPGRGSLTPLPVDMLKQPDGDASQAGGKNGAGVNVSGPGARDGIVPVKR